MIENDRVRIFSPDRLFGRSVIYSDADEITADNVLSVLQEVLPAHLKNRQETQYLYDYYTGRQPILHRVKEIRPEICNRITENRANEIVSFWSGYLLGDPVQYVGRDSSDEEADKSTYREAITRGISQLNNLMLAGSKDSKDIELLLWMLICGVGYRIVLPPKDDIDALDILTLDSRYTFMIYSSDFRHRELGGVICNISKNGETTYNVYTNTMLYVVRNGTVIDAQPHIIESIPIIEYPLNTARLGIFEIVLSLLDTLNTVSSNRVDGVEQFIQAIMVFEGVDVTREQLSELKDLGALKLPPANNGAASRVYYLNQQLDQSQTQTLIDYIHQTILDICNMPNRNGGSSTSDTGSAVILRDGWSSAEARAKEIEKFFKRSERQFLKVALKIAGTLYGLDLRPQDIDIKFTRRNYENILTKAQVLDTLLKNDKVSPLLAYTVCGLCSDPAADCQAGLDNYRRVKQEEEEDLAGFAGRVADTQKQTINEAVP